MKKIMWAGLLLCIATAAWAAVAPTGGRNVAAGTGDYDITWSDSRTRDFSTYAVSADVKMILFGRTGAGGTNDTITVYSGTVFNVTQELSGARIDRTTSTQVIHTWTTR